MGPFGRGIFPSPLDYKVGQLSQQFNPLKKINIQSHKKRPAISGAGRCFFYRVLERDRGLHVDGAGLADVLAFVVVIEGTGEIFVVENIFHAHCHVQI